MFEQICPIDPSKYMDLHFSMHNLIQYNDIRASGLEKEIVDLLTRLNSYCFVLTQSCMELIWSGFVWQAEILERSLLEATIKLIYISIDKSKMKQKVNEFQNIISDINQYKRRKEMIDFLDNIDNADEILKHTYQNVINNDVNMDLNKNKRNKIMEKWSFNSMIREIDSYNIEWFNKNKYFQNYYANCSHYIHVDIDCLDLIWDRENRNNEEYAKITLAHMGRELSDLYSYNFTRTHILMKLYNIDLNILKECIRSKKEIIDSISTLENEWNVYYKNNYMNKQS
jgi:hypothetical protein